VSVKGQGFADLVIVAVKPGAEEGTATYLRRKLSESSRKAEGEGRDTLVEEKSSILTVALRSENFFFSWKVIVSTRKLRKDR